ncbi:hypothetical protein [Cohnella silvisoli]|uniref:O-antigen ligase domain-containing protein n=1 Tax=Cohnella silvisoli TaxID=2873699 RepID=A0ABV1KVC7_9BACL|nr:hypothetical protein [Cohnella silvisoli]MCD9023458.1 hypothetical protein [Cohnella silvisoli]
MIEWIEANRDGLLGNILISALFLPIAYLFTLLLDRWKSSSIKNRGTKPKKKKNNKIKNNNQNNIENDLDDEFEIETRTSKPAPKNPPNPPQSQSPSDPWVWIIGCLFALAVGIKFYIPHKTIIINIIYLFSIFALFFCLIKASKEYKRPSAKGIGTLLLWNAFMWLLILILMHLVSHPIYYSEKVYQAELDIINGVGVLDVGIDNFMYLGYQLIGVISSILLLLFNIGAQIFVLFLWWNNSPSSISNVRNKILRFFIFIYYPKGKYIFSSMVLVLISFGFVSGLLIKLITENKAG